MQDFDGGYDMVLIEEVLSNGETGWLAVHPDLPGCNATGLTSDEAAVNLEKSKDAWMEAARVLGDDIPAPKESPVCSVIYRRDTSAPQTNYRDAVSRQEEVEFPNLYAA